MAVFRVPQIVVISYFTLWRGFIYLKIGNVHIIKSKGGAIKIGLLNFDVVVMLKTSDAVFRFYVSVFSNQ